MSNNVNTDSNDILKNLVNSTNKAAKATQLFSNAILQSTNALVQLTAGFTGLWKALAIARIAFGGNFSVGNLFSKMHQFLTVRLTSAFTKIGIALQKSSGALAFLPAIGAFLTASAATLASVVAAVIVAVAAVTASLLALAFQIGLMITPFEPMKAIMQQLVTIIGPSLTNFASALSRVISSIVVALSEMLRAFQPVISVFTSFVTSSFSKFLVELGEVAAQFLKTFAPILKLFFVLSSVLIRIMGVILSIINAVLTGLEPFIEILNMIIDALSFIIQIIGTAVQVVGAVIKILIALVNAVVSLITFGLAKLIGVKPKTTEEENKEIQEKNEEMTKAVWPDILMNILDYGYERIKHSVLSIFDSSIDPSTEALKATSGFKEYSSLKTQAQETEFGLMRKLGGPSKFTDPLSFWKEAQTKMFEMSPAEREQIRLQMEGLALMKKQIAIWENHFQFMTGKDAAQLVIK